MKKVVVTNEDDTIYIHYPRDGLNAEYFVDKAGSLSIHYGVGGNCVVTYAPGYWSMVEVVELQ